MSTSSSIDLSALLTNDDVADFDRRYAAYSGKISWRSSYVNFYYSAYSVIIYG